MPIGPMMREHRLIERMFKVVEAKVAEIDRTGEVEVSFIDEAVDFVRTYADKCHHGKEEDILFRELGDKKITDEHDKTVRELINDHIWGRETVAALVAARDRYAGGDKEALGEIRDLLARLAEFYPKHIEREDKNFFIPVMDYFTQEEQDAMLAEGNEFDRQFDHEKYKRIVEKWGG